MQWINLDMKQNKTKRLKSLSFFLSKNLGDHGLEHNMIKTNETNEQEKNQKRNSYITHRTPPPLIQNPRKNL